MKNKKINACLIITLCFMTLFTTTAKAQQKNQVVHLAKLQIDPAQLAAYNAALKEEIAASIRIEPGVLALNAVAAKKDPSSITILEVYADTAAYQAHLQTPHFKKYKATVKDMVKALELIDVDPIILGAKPKE